MYRLHWLLQKPKDIAAILLAVGLLVLLGYVYVSNATRKPNRGLGPEWVCAPEPHGICVKKDAKAGNGKVEGGSGQAAQP